ncbi:MAG TPA: ATP-binding protein [Epulopiscium sp.]|nr:ATP-binding protein [Candidatus Epulonipiscium sp.]
MEAKIYEHCKALRLSSTFATNAVVLDGENHQEYLIRLLKAEVIYRHEKRINLNLKQANLDLSKTFGNYEFKDIDLPATINQELIQDVEFLSRTENLIMYGQSGRGKTHLATAIAIEACMQGKKVKFFRTAALVNELVAAKEKGTLLPMLKKLSKLDLLICDEWGYIPFDAEGSQLLFQVISDCYEKISLIITTNLEFSKWNGIFYEEKLTNALIDRLVHHSHLLVFNGESHRLKDSLMKKND